MSFLKYKFKHKISSHKFSVKEQGLPINLEFYNYHIIVPKNLLDKYVSKKNYS